MNMENSVNTTSTTAQPLDDTKPTFLSETAKELQIKTIPRRRTSLFQPELTVESKEGKYSPEYIGKLRQELLQWQELNTKFKEKYKELKANGIKPSVYDNDTNYYEQYLENVQDLFAQTTYMTELHDDAVNYLASRKAELEDELKLTQSKISEKLTGEEKSDK